MVLIEMFKWYGWQRSPVSQVGEDRDANSAANIRHAHESSGTFNLGSTPAERNTCIADLSMSAPMSKSQHFHWISNKVGNEEEELHEQANTKTKVMTQLQRRRKLQAAAVSRLRSAVLTAFGKNRAAAGALPLSLVGRVVGTLFGSKKGHVHFALQRHPTSHPAFLIELATPISALVRDMASGLVRIALECDKNNENAKRLLLEEPVWRTYCNGKKAGFASKRKECGTREWKVLKAVEPISMGAGVLPRRNDDDEEEDGGEVMYMRAKFERVVGSRDSEAFYMMNPDSNGAPELSIYLLRV